MRVLVVEDEGRIAELVSAALRAAGFAVDVCASAGDGAAAQELTAYDALVLDLGLPDGDGLAVLRAARRGGGSVPVLILTARDAVEDRVAGLDAGADDYLTKPFATAELISRIKALLRRPGLALGATLAAGGLLFDTLGREAQVAGRPLALARQELAILEHLMRRLGRVVPRDVLEEKLYGEGGEIASNAIPVHIHHLRRKLADAGAGCAIQTVRGIGYFLAEERA
ncbi:MAG TPA: response regulator transcription factor [Novosphingobium sp.]|nr:response regulator transcription factor [Novosphingobium sp.]HZV10294.1 response regulator transcription factor [Novosphingobium sp.]